MKYVGGKSRLAKYIVPLFGDLSDRTYVEPFVGSAAVVSRIQARERIASDNHPYLIAMHQAVQDGWEPPQSVSVDEYTACRQNPDAYPMEYVGFVGFACSFGAKWWGGYARGGPRNYAAEGYRNLMTQRPLLADVCYQWGPYDEIVIPPASFIYCDPPYAATQGYAGAGTFDSTTFWAWCRDRVAEGHTVAVSEFSAPPDFRSVWSMTRAASLDKNTGGKVSTEHLFVHESQSLGGT